jgi:hypothetical protein
MSAPRSGVAKVLGDMAEQFFEGKGDHHAKPSKNDRQQSARKSGLKLRKAA